MVSIFNNTLINPYDNFSSYFDIDIPMNITISVPTVIMYNSDNVILICLYCVLFTTGAIGNVTVLTALIRSRRRKSRVNLMMTHLSFADSMVTFILIPLEIGWRTTEQWLAGNMACKVFQVLRAFGLYLSSNVLVCISIDRYFAVLHPLSVSVARQRSKIMLAFAWIIALTCSLPQSYVFKVKSHPNKTDFFQCVSFGTSKSQERTYTMFALCAMYFIPLAIITLCYLCIYFEIGKNCREISNLAGVQTRTVLRRSDQRLLERARRRTLKMTVTIVFVFALCGLPYVVMTLWYMFDRKSAQRVERLIQDIFFIMAVSNSCMNPIVYGTYALNFKRNLQTFFIKVFCGNNSCDDTIIGVSRSSMKKQLDPIRGDSVVSDHKTKLTNNNQFDLNYHIHSYIESEPPCRTNYDDREFKNHHLSPTKSCELFCNKERK